MYLLGLLFAPIRNLNQTKLRENKIGGKCLLADVNRKDTNVWGCWTTDAGSSELTDSTLIKQDIRLLSSQLTLKAQGRTLITLSLCSLLEPIAMAKESEELWPRQPVSCAHPCGQLLQMEGKYVVTRRWPLGYQYHSKLSIRNEKKKDMLIHIKASMSVKCLFRLKRERKDKEVLSDFNTTEERLCSAEGVLSIH